MVSYVIVWLYKECQCVCVCVCVIIMMSNPNHHTTSHSHVVADDEPGRRRWLTFLNAQLHNLSVVEYQTRFNGARAIGYPLPVYDKSRYYVDFQNAESVALNASVVTDCIEELRIDAKLNPHAWLPPRACLPAEIRDCPAKTIREYMKTWVRSDRITTMKRARVAHSLRLSEGGEED
jgi:hypothetical protein